jgi:predicted NBD/HSP70 family sugar kinase
MALGAPLLLLAQRRRPRRVVRRTRFVVRPGHPLARAARIEVNVHAPRRVVVVGAPVRFLPMVTFAAVATSLPPRDRLVWQDSETLEKEEDWAELNFGVDDRGDALLLDIDGRVQMNFAELTFENGDVQVVDYNEHAHAKGIYRLYDFPGVRHVKTVRLVARAQSDDATLRLYLKR